MARVPVFDADNHFYETRDALTKFLPDRYRGAIDYVEVRGRTKIVVRGQISNYIPNPTFDVVARPGAQEEYYRKGNPEGKSTREIFGAPVKCLDGWREPAARLELMDEQGIDRSLMFPTLASLVEERMSDAPELTHAVIHALNEWMYETWRFDYEGRIFSTPVIAMPIVEEAVREVEWAAERGAKVVLVRPAPVPGIRGSRSFGLPEFDPVWEKIVEHDLVVALHSSDSGYEKYNQDWTGRSDEYEPFVMNAFRMVTNWRAIQDSIAALVCDGALSRHPELKVAVVENGSSWVESLLKTLASVYKKMPQAFAEAPIDQIRRNVSISPFWEESAVDLAALIGEDNVIFGSDYPHPEGLADPAAFVDELEGASDEFVAKFMGGNLARLLHLEQVAV
jgi:predicted TIM-barrel fold metal-dependent hydrolase